MGGWGEERDRGLDSGDKDLVFMAEAVKEAGKALKKAEVPIGAVIVHEGKVIGRGHNRKESGLDATRHAEMTAIRDASKRLKRWRLSNATLYVTLEPCLMCMGAIIQARIPRLVFGPFDPKAGAAGSLYDVSKDRRLNHRVRVQSGVLANEAGAMLKDFFKTLRKRRRG